MRVSVPLTLGAIVLAWLCFLLVRTLLFVRAGTGLRAAAETLPREYSLPGTGPTLTVLGDSIGVGVGAESLQLSLPYLAGIKLNASSVRNLAATGARLSDVVTKQLPSLPEKPGIVLISVSANDATHGTDEGAFRADLGTLLTKTDTASAVYLTTTPAFKETPALPSLVRRVVGRRSGKLTAIIKEVSAVHANVRLVDLNADTGLGRDMYAPDGFHPNGAGYVHWSALISGSGN